MTIEPRTRVIDRERHGQRVVDREVGDCWRACMSVLLDVPNGDHMPNVHDDRWTLTWQHFLADFGLAFEGSHPKGPIWKSHRWLASVPSKNISGVSHAIVMDHHRVVFDPSPRRRYRRGESLLGGDVVTAGTWLEVADASRLDKFVRWQRRSQAKDRGI